MFKKTVLAKSLLVAFGGTALYTGAALAQTTPPASPAVPQQLQRVEITGSAIKQTDAETVVPVTVIKADDLRKQGITSVQQALAQVSASTTTQSSSQSVGSNTGGASFANLRGIGANKTLVLLNGRRLANNALDGASPDLNMIPFAALERIEVLRDGASALYGTDAIGGVINFITNKSYNQGQITIDYSVPQHSGGRSGGANASIGMGDLDVDGFNLWGVLDYHKTDPIGSLERGFSNRGYIPERGVDRTSGTTFPANYSQGGRSANPTFPGCQPSVGSLNTGNSRTNCRFDFNPYSYLTPATEVTSLLGRASFKLDANHTVVGEYLISQNNNSTQIGPVPQTGNTINPGTRYFPGNGITPGPTNFAIDPTLPVGVNWRSVDAGGRTEKDINTSQRFVLSLDGNDFGWDYNTGVTYNESRVQENLTGGYNVDSLITAGLANGTINPFGPQDAAGTAYLQQSQLRGEVRNSVGKVWSVDARASREIGDWFHAGTPAAIAIGGEFRHERYQDIINPAVSDEASSTGLDSAGSVSGRSRNVEGIYTELNVPFLKSLTGTVAVRYDKYSDAGNTTNPKVGLRFQPIQEFVARASYSTGFRAPSLYELYSPNALTYTANSYNDPVQCPGGTPIAGANPGIACNQQFLAQTGGNKNLKPEKAKNLTVGFVLEPAKDLTLGLDFWWIRIRDQISGFPESAIFQNPAQFQNRFHRAPDGSLTVDGADPGYVVTTNDNLGKLATNGVDVSTNYRLKLGAGNNVTVGFLGTYVQGYKFQREIDGPYFQKVSTFIDSGSGQQGPAFRWKHSLTVAYNATTWSAGVTNRFQSGYVDQNAVDPQFANHVSSYTLFDAFGSYLVTKDVNVTFGIRNLLDRDPSFSNQVTTFQVGYDPRFSDPVGRAYYLKATYAFK